MTDPWAELAAVAEDGPPPPPDTAPPPDDPTPIVPGNIDLDHRPVVNNHDGSISTVRSMSYGTDQGEVLIPTVSEDGRILQESEAIDYWRKRGQHLGIFRTPQDATRYAESLHRAQERQYVPSGGGGNGDPWAELAAAGDTGGGDAWTALADADPKLSAYRSASDRTAAAKQQADDYRYAGSFDDAGPSLPSLVPDLPVGPATPARPVIASLDDPRVKAARSALADLGIRNPKHDQVLALLASQGYDFDQLGLQGLAPGPIESISTGTALGVGQGLAGLGQGLYGLGAMARIPGAQDRAERAAQLSQDLGQLGSESGASEIAQLGASAVVQLAPALAAGPLGAEAGLIASSAIPAGQAFQEAKTAGAGDGEAYVQGLGQGAMNYLTSKVFGGALSPEEIAAHATTNPTWRQAIRMAVNDPRGAGARLSEVVAESAREGGKEAIENGVQQWAQAEFEQRYDPEKAAETRAGVGQAALLGGALGSGMRVIGAAPSVGEQHIDVPGIPADFSRTAALDALDPARAGAVAPPAAHASETMPGSLVAQAPPVAELPPEPWRPQPSVDWSDRPAPPTEEDYAAVARAPRADAQTADLSVLGTGATPVEQRANSETVDDARLVPVPDGRRGAKLPGLAQAWEGATGEQRVRDPEGWARLADAQQERDAAARPQTEESQKPTEPLRPVTADLLERSARQQPAAPIENAAVSSPTQVDAYREFVDSLTPEERGWVSKDLATLGDTPQDPYSAVQGLRQGIQMKRELAERRKKREAAAAAAQESSQPAATAPAPVTFTTERGGSIYEANTDGTTRRTKGASGGAHEGDVGRKDRSERTVYVSPEASVGLGSMYASTPDGSAPRVMIEGDRIVLRMKGGGRNPDGTLRTIERSYPYETAPRVGLHPFEFLPRGGMHLGSKITEVNESPKPAEPAPTPPAAPAANPKEAGHEAENRQEAGQAEAPSLLTDRRGVVDPTRAAINENPERAPGRTPEPAPASREAAAPAEAGARSDVPPREAAGAREPAKLAQPASVERRSAIPEPRHGGGHDIINAIDELGGIRPRPRKHVGGEYDDQPALRGIYRRIMRGEMAPDQVAAALRDRGVGDGTVPTMWRLVAKAQESRIAAPRRTAAEGRRAVEDLANEPPGRADRVEQPPRATTEDGGVPFRLPREEPERPLAVTDEDIRRAVGGHANVARTADGWRVTGRGGVVIEVKRAPAGEHADASGWWDPRSRTLYLRPGEANVWHLHHELVHAFRAFGLIHSGEWRALLGEAKRNGQWDEARRLYGKVYRDASMVEEEAVALLLEDYANGGIKPANLSLWQRIVDTFRNLTSAVFGTAPTGRKALERVAGGEPLSRAATTEPGGEARTATRRGMLPEDLDPAVRNQQDLFTEPKPEEPNAAPDAVPTTTGDWREDVLRNRGKREVGQQGLFDEESTGTAGQQSLFSLRRILPGKAPLDAAMSDLVRLAPDPEAEEAMQKARGAPDPTIMDRLKASADRLRRSFRQQFVHLDPKTDGVWVDRLRTLQTARESAPVLAWRAIADTVRGLSPKDALVFERNLILPDIQKDIEGGLYNDRPIPFFDRDHNPGDPLAPIAERAKAVQRQLDAFKDQASPAVQAALEKRHAFQKQLTQALIDTGQLDEKVAEDPRYFHRQVLAHLDPNTDFLGTGGRDARAPTRGFQRSRKGGGEFNTSWVEAEHEYVSQALANLAAVNALADLRANADIKDGLKAEAKARNLDGMADWWRQEVEDQGGMIDAEADHWEKPYKQRIAMNLDSIAQGIAQGIEKGNPTGAGWARWGNLFGAMREAKASGESVEHPDLMPFLSWLAGGGVNGDKLSDTLSRHARAVFSSIVDRESFIRQKLGDGYSTWRSLLGEHPDYSLWQPEKGLQFHFGWTVNDDAMRKALVTAGIDPDEEGVADQLPDVVRIAGKGLGQGLMVSGPKPQWVLPERLAKQLNDMPSSPGATGHPVERALSAANATWKQLVLMGPFRGLKYSLNNLIGDADALFAGAPGAFKQVPQALSDVRRYLAGGDVPSEVRSRMEWAAKLGLLQSGMTLNEIPDISAEGFLRPFTGKEGPNALEKWFSLWRNVNAVRESALRVAAARDFFASLRRGNQPMGASRQDEMRALYAEADAAEGEARKDLHARIAAKLARELMGDYGATSEAGSWIARYMIPFWRWQEINFPRYVRLFKNASASGKARFLTAKGGALTAKVALQSSAFYLMTQAWNAAVRGMLGMRDDEDPNRDRNRMFILMPWRGKDGTVYSLGYQGALADAAGWLSLHDLPEDVSDIREGAARGKGWEAARNVAMDSAVWGWSNRLAQGVSPFLKAPIESVTGRTIFPDIRRPGRINDQGAYWSNLLGMQSPYRFATGTTRGGAGAEAWDVVGYRFDPGAQDFRDAQALVQSFKQDRGKAGANTGGQTLYQAVSGDPGAGRSEALVRLKTAVRRGDMGEAERQLRAYIADGGTWDGFKASSRSADPLAAVARGDRQAFLDTLNARERRIIDRAQRWNEQTWMATGDERVLQWARRIFTEAGGKKR